LNINDFSRELLRQLNLYGNVLNEQIEVESEKAAKDLVKALKQESPELTGDYAKSWRIKRGRNKFIVHNKDHYQLTHLLEFGHAKRGGGRVAAQVHIRPAEEKAVGNFLESIERVIEE
jgi:Bacteriophage HK97-gp10, putative tail-component